MATKTHIKTLENGLTIWDAREDDKEVIGYTQDVSPTLKFAKSLASDMGYTNMGIKESMWHYATIPDAVLLKLWFEHGINPYQALEKADERKLFSLLNTEFKDFKTTTKTHNV